MCHSTFSTRVADAADEEAAPGSRAITTPPTTREEESESNLPKDVVEEYKGFWAPAKNAVTGGVVVPEKTGVAVTASASLKPGSNSPAEVGLATETDNSAPAVNESAEADEPAPVVNESAKADNSAPAGSESAVSEPSFVNKLPGFVVFDDGQPAKYIESWFRLFAASKAVAVTADSPRGE